MADNNKASNFGTVKNLREWFNEALDGDRYLFRRISETEQEQCFYVDLIWDGTNYHIAYENAKGIKYVQPFTYTDERVWSVRTENQTEN